MANSDLEKYVLQLKEKKIPDDQIKERLLKSGWGQREVEQAFQKDDPVAGELPPPPVPHFSMWITFEYILVFISMYVSFTALGGIFHYGVDKFVPDPLQRSVYAYTYSSSWNDSMVPGYLAAILVTFPIFAVLFIILRRQMIEKPAVRNIRSRKILIYITLVITFIYMIFHLISTVYSFLQGTSTMRTILHLLVNLLIAGSIFAYLLFEVREDRKIV